MLALTKRYPFCYELQPLPERAGFERVDIYRDGARIPFDGTGVLAVARRSE